MKTTEVELVAPRKWGSKEITKIVLREPTMFDFFDIGEPTLVTRTEIGTSVLVHNHEAIKKYIFRLMTEPSGNLNLVDELPLGDALRLKGAVLDFFEDAQSVGSNSPQKPLSESSDGSPEANSSQPE